jgi:ketopantoate reductase
VTVDDAAFVPEVHKLLVSTCINPLTALYRIPNGLACEPPYATHFARLAHEGAAVLRATGLDIDDRSALELAAGVARATAPTHQALYRLLLALESRSSQNGLADVGRRREGSREGSP